MSNKECQEEKEKNKMCDNIIIRTIRNALIQKKKEERKDLTNHQYVEIN